MGRRMAEIEKRNHGMSFRLTKAEYDDYEKWCKETGTYKCDPLVETIRNIIDNHKKSKGKK